MQLLCVERLYFFVYACGNVLIFGVIYDELKNVLYFAPLCPISLGRMSYVFTGNVLYFFRGCAGREFY